MEFEVSCSNNIIFSINNKYLNPKTFDELTKELDNWIEKYFHFNGLTYRMDTFFAYDYVDHRIIINCLDNLKETHKRFRQFLYEYGCNEDLTNYNNNTLAFLHELAHCLTTSWFDNIEMVVCNFQKESVNNAFDYWEVPDEFEANMVVVDFINTNPEAISELDNIFMGW